MKTRFLPFLFAGFAAAVLTAGAATPLAPAPEADADIPLRAYTVVGAIMAENNQLTKFGWNERQIDAFVEGLRAAMRGAPGDLNDPAAAKLMASIARRLEAAQAEEAQVRAQFFASAANREKYMKDMTRAYTLQRLDSGMSYRITQSGSGARPQPEDTVVVSYRVSAAVDNSDLPELAAEHRKVRVAELPPGVAEGLQMMSVGSTAMLLVPAELSFGEGAWPKGVDRGAPIIVRVMLHEVVAAR